MPRRKRTPEEEPRFCNTHAAKALARKPARLDRARGLALLFTPRLALSTSMLVGHASAQEATIVTLGDSNTSGFGVGAQETFPARLEAIIDSCRRQIALATVAERLCVAPAYQKPVGAPDCTTSLVMLHITPILRAAKPVICPVRPFKFFLWLLIDSHLRHLEQF